MSLDQAYRGKTIFVTGDTGFKGSWLVMWLLELGAKVVGYAHAPASLRDNFVTCGLAERIRHVDGDVRDYARLAAALAECEAEVVFHLAAQAIVLESYSDPRTTFETNVMGVVNLLEAVRFTPSVRAVVVVTSDKCYENQEWDWGYRESDRLGGKDPYSASKGAAELAVASMRRSFFMDDGCASIATVRAGNVVGGGDWAPHRIVPDCVRALRAREPIVIRNPGAVRPWQHVLDALHGYLRLGARLCVDGARLASGWNFGPLPGAMVSVRELVEAMIAAWGEGSYHVEGDRTTRPEEARFLHLDISKARNQLDWCPLLSFSQTISMTVEGYRAESSDATSLYEHRTEQIRMFHGAP